jgi:uncharacterized iron-regulated protein
MNKAISLILIAFMLMSFAKDRPAYYLYNQKGKEVNYGKMLDELAEADIVLFGEFHNNPICHWLQIEVTKDLYELKKEKLVLGAEMFERDNQLLMDEYLSGLHAESKFEADARLWKNYKTDYRPLLNFAKDQKLPFIATNIPRRYASLVYKEGFEGLEKLSPEAKLLFAKLPVAYDANLDCYKSMIADGTAGHTNENLPKAQAIKDATMAESILNNWKDGKLFLHYNGAYHSDNFESIVWYLKKLKPSLKIATITTIEFEDLSTLNDSTFLKANFTILVPENMTKTH